MNRYGTQAMRHWQRTDPERYAAIEQPEEFFTALGEQVEEQIQERTVALAGQDQPGESYLEKVGRLRMARFTAEAEVLRELVLIGAPSQTEEIEEPAPESWNLVSRAMQEAAWDEEGREEG